MGVHLLKRQQSAAAAAAAAAASMLPPKGCMAVRVVGPGGGEGERFVVPVGYLKHPLFVGLLKEAEEEYGFEQKGAITIPCGVDHFRRVQGIIHHQTHHHHHHHVLSSSSAAAAAHGSSGHLHFHIAACFRA